jgi:hypothetical protein
VGLRRLLIAVLTLATFTACGVKGPEQWRKSDCEKAGEELCVDLSGRALDKCVAQYVYDCRRPQEP